MKFSKLVLSSLLAMTFSLNVFASPSVDEFLQTIAKEQSDKSTKKEEYQPDLYTLGPMSNYLSREQYKDFKEELARGADKTNVLEGKVITLNTKDREGCEAARVMMNLEENVCDYDPKKPFVSLVVTRPVENREYFERKINLPKMSDKQKVGLKTLATFGAMGAAAFGVIYALPESVSKWDKSRGFGALAGQYKDRVSGGPIIDKDDWAINYIGHPLSGAIYYTAVRHEGYSRFESALFSVAMSTFFWEYGIEAFAEVPSIQDLILTPLIGSILGEVFYTWGTSIEKNGGKLAGSERLGKTATILMNPAGALAKKINKTLKYNFIKDVEFSLTDKLPMPRNVFFDDAFKENDSYLGLKLQFKF